MNHDVSHRYEWKTMPWRKIEVRVFKLQRRIYHNDPWRDPESLQLPETSRGVWSAKSLAVRRVTQENKGKKRRLGSTGSKA